MIRFILSISLLISIIFNANASNSYDTKEVSKFIDYMAKKHDYKKNDLRNNICHILASSKDLIMNPPQLKQNPPNNSKI